jgi:CRISPR-associated endonuclease/helicase Cas3
MRVLRAVEAETIMSKLLAKSPKAGHDPITLLQHTLDVMNAGEWLYGTATPTRLGRAWLRFFRIPEDGWRAFRNNLLAAAAFHDWGKANDGMQALLNSRGSQIIRHEHLSALMLTLDGVMPWLKSRADIDWEVVLAAVLGHHLKAGIKDLDDRPKETVRHLELFHEHDDFKEMLGRTADRLELPGTGPRFTPTPFWAFRDLAGRLLPGAFELEAHRQKLKDHHLRRFETALRKDVARKRLLWAVRAALIASDAVGSALPRVGKDIRPWIAAAFDDARVCDGPFVWNEVINKRTAEVARKKKRPFVWNDFQKDCDALPERALLLAPCGSGKTLAAWRWIASQLKLRPAARVIFLYPTRATAKEGFRDYVAWAPEADAALMHGTAEFDLEGMWSNPDDPRCGNRYGNRDETDRRLYALRFWTRRVFSATVDQFLAFMQYTYGPVCLLPLLADSVVVIDEVHSFDRAMFSALKGFLTTFDVPVLCMTATLPKDRQAELAASPMTIYDEKPGELKSIAEAPRYRLRRTTEADVPALIRRALEEDKRVLWVVNQVKRAQRAARQMACDFSPADLQQEMLHVTSKVPLFCYHSRYKLIDRVRRHNDVVDAFRAECPPALAVTTQVCEMSLDMDADLLITEECPITSLIQRMGRCNRDRNPRPGAGEVLVYQPLDEQGRPDLLPYDAAMLTGVAAFLNELSGRSSLNQTDLELALANSPLPPALGDKMSSFLESGPYALGGEEDFRDIAEFSVRAVLAKDVAAFLKLKDSKKPTDGLIVPVPFRLGRERDGRLPHYLAVADEAHYHAAVGFCDEPLTPREETNNG